LDLVVLACLAFAEYCFMISFLDRVFLNADRYRAEAWPGGGGRLSFLREASRLPNTPSWASMMVPA
jgi:hypothetical protein